MNPVFGTYRYEIRPTSSVIPPLCPCGWDAVFVLEFFHAHGQIVCSQCNPKYWEIRGIIKISKIIGRTDRHAPQ